MRLASIQAISGLRPIPEADRIEAATVLGYQTVVKKGEFKPGDLCVWHEPDTVVPERPIYEFLRKPGFRLRVSRFKGQVSQGLALPLSILPPGEYQPGDDVTEIVGIRKYEKPVPPGLAGIAKGPFPPWIPKTDEPNLRSFPEALAEFQGRECVLTQKMDGTSGTFFFRKGEFGICSRNLELLPDDKSAFWRAAADFKLAEALGQAGGDFALQGEVYGPGIQGNHTGAAKVQVGAFNLFDIGKHSYLGHRELAKFCQSTGVPMVPVVWEGVCQFTLEQLVQLANEQKYANGSPAEGIVLRPVEEARSQILDSGRLSAKILSENYALKHGE